MTWNYILHYTVSLPRSLAGTDKDYNDDEDDDNDDDYDDDDDDDDDDINFQTEFPFVDLVDFQLIL